MVSVFVSIYGETQFGTSDIVKTWKKWYVLNLEHGSVGLVGGGFGVIVHVLSGEERFLVRKPEVGGSGIIDNLEGLGRGTCCFGVFECGVSRERIRREVHVPTETSP